MAMKENSWSPSAGIRPVPEPLITEGMRREGAEKGMLTGLEWWGEEDLRNREMCRKRHVVRECNTRGAFHGQSRVQQSCRLPAASPGFYLRNKDFFLTNQNCNGRCFCLPTKAIHLVKTDRV